MQKGYSKIAEQVGRYGIYGEIELTCDFSENYREIDIVLPNELEQWRTGVLFGAAYFWDHTALKGGLIVHVKSISSNPVDTNTTVIAFLTTLALVKASEINMRSTPFFDKHSITFCFPK